MRTPAVERRSALSPDQERQWLVERLLPAHAAGAGADPTVARLRGPLSVPALVEAWRVLAARHDSLRTRFPLADGVAWQAVAAEVPTPLPVRVVDLNGSAGALAGVLATAGNHLAELPVGPLWQVLVLRLHPTDHVLVLQLQHMIADLWSVAILVEEFCTAYAALAAARPVRLPPPPATPAELASRRRARLTDRRRGALCAWWRERLDGAAPVALPADRPRPVLPNLSSHVHTDVIDARPADGLRRLALACGTTLFAVLLAGFAALLTRWSGRHDLTVVSVGAGRRGRTEERAVGLLTECLVLRVDTGGDPAFVQLVGRAGTTLLDALDHAEAPFADLVALVDPGRDLEPSPLRQLGLSLHNTPVAAPALPGLALTPVPAPAAGQAGTSEADVWVEVFDHGAGPLGLRLQLDDVMFAAGTPVLIAGALTRLLTAAVADPQLAVTALPMTGLPWPLGPMAPAGRPAPVSPAPVSPAALDLVRRTVRELLGLPADPLPADNIFRLGASSLDAARLAARLATQTGRAVTLYDLMTTRTVHAIAMLVGAVTPPGRRSR